MTQQDLGTALWTLGYALWTVGERENGAERLQQATAAYRAALGVLGPGGLLGGPPGGPSCDWPSSPGASPSSGPPSECFP
jgi:hypothetical protein